MRLGKTLWASRNTPVPVAGSRAREQDEARAAAPAGLGGGLAAHTPLPRPGGALASRGCPRPTGRFAEEVGGKDVWEFVNVINSGFCSGAYLIDAMITWSRSI